MTNSSRVCAIAIAVLIFATAAVAQTVSGTVTNGTTNRPAAGIEVTLVDPMGGMAEVGTAKTDAQGHFSVRPSSPPQGPRLVRATKDNVNYFKMVPPGVPSADLEVYDAASHVDGIGTVVEVLRLQSSGGTLQAETLFAVRNQSSPPRTLATNATYEIALPSGAEMDNASVQGPGGQPISTVATPLAKKGHYAFSYALKPGETRFQIAYHMPYSGQASIAPELPVALQHFVIMVPESMKWTPTNPAAYQSMQNQPGVNLQVAANPSSPDAIAFTVTGTGILQEQEQQAQGSSGTAPVAPMQSAGGNDSRPGGGLGPPIDAPDALANYRWWVLGVLGITMCGGAFVTMRRSQAAAATNGAPIATLPKGSALPRLQPVPNAAPAKSNVAPAPSVPTGNVLLDAVKEELFQLELERHGGKISEQDYAKQKAGLDATLARLLSRGNFNNGQ